VINYLKEQTGVAFNSVFEDCLYLYDILEIEQKINQPLPEWTAKVFPHPLKELANFAFSHMVAPNTAMKRLRGGL